MRVRGEFTETFITTPALSRVYTDTGDHISSAKTVVYALQLLT